MNTVPRLRPLSDIPLAPGHGKNGPESDQKHREMSATVLSVAEFSKLLRADTTNAAEEHLIFTRWSKQAVKLNADLATARVCLIRVDQQLHAAIAVYRVAPHTAGFFTPWIIGDPPDAEVLHALALSAVQDCTDNNVLKVVLPNVTEPRRVIDLFKELHLQYSRTKQTGEATYMEFFVNLYHDRHSDEAPSRAD